MTYLEKLKHPKWQKKRLEILNRDSFLCQYCGDNNSSLHVHHRNYSGIDPWDIEDKFLITLCESCHSEEEKNLKNLKSILFETLKACNFSASDINSIDTAFMNLDFSQSDANTFSLGIENAFSANIFIKFILKLGTLSHNQLNDVFKDMEVSHG